MRLFVLGLASLLLALALTGCGGEGKTASAPVASKTPVVTDPMSITPSPILLKDLKLGEAQQRPVSFSFSVSARLEINHHRMTRVGTPVNGRIVALLAHEGDVVKKGEVLATINSTALSEAQLGYLKALSAVTLNQRAVERAQQLLQADVIGQAELQRREAELSEAKAELDASRDQLLLLGMATEAIDELRRSRTINSVTRVVAPIAGTVIEHFTTLGQMMQPSDTIFEIADLSQLWVVAKVPEQEAGLLRLGQAVEAELATFPGRKLIGKLSFVGSTVNPETRTVEVRMDLSNPKGDYKPAMLATMFLKEQPVQRQLIPIEAIVREGNSEFVFVEQAAGVFRLEQVELGEEFESMRVMLKPLPAGRRIVLDGAFHLNNERRKLLVQASEGE